jgi:hypothetical protein
VKTSDRAMKRAISLPTCRKTFFEMNVQFNIKKNQVDPLEKDALAKTFGVFSRNMKADPNLQK